MKKKIAFLLLISLIGVTGCTQSLSKKTQEVEAMESKVELTQEKKDFLAAMSIDEERVQDGDLYEWQEEVLRQYDYAVDYLNKKYPSHTFKLTSCNPKGRDEEFSTFWFNADGETQSYDLYLEVADNGAYSCEDNYYGKLLKDSYDSAFLALLQKSVPDCMGVASEFNTVQGEKFDEKITGEEVLNGNDKISNTTYIYAVSSDTSQAETLAKQIEDLVKEKKIYGSYYIEILNTDPGNTYSSTSLKEYVQEKETQIVVLEQKFNQFD